MTAFVGHTPDLLPTATAAVEGIPDDVLSLRPAVLSDEVLVVAQDTMENETPTGKNIGMTVLKTSVIAYEMLPIDDVLRYGMTIGAVAHTQSPLVGAAVLGGATLITEVSAVLASAKWIAEDRIGGVLDKAHHKIDAFKHKLNTLMPRVRPGRFMSNIPETTDEDVYLPKTAQAVVALNLGSVLLMEAKQRAKPGRTAEQNRRDGLISAGLVSAYMASEGALLGTGAEHITNPAYLTAAAVCLAGLEYGVHKLRKTMKKGA